MMSTFNFSFYRWPVILASLSLALFSMLTYAKPQETARNYQSETDGDVFSQSVSISNALALALREKDEIALMNFRAICREAISDDCLTSHWPIAFQILKGLHHVDQANSSLNTMVWNLRGDLIRRIPGRTKILYALDEPIRNDMRQLCEEFLDDLNDAIIPPPYGKAVWHTWTIAGPPEEVEKLRRELELKYQGQDITNRIVHKQNRLRIIAGGTTNFLCHVTNLLERVAGGKEETNPTPTSSTVANPDGSSIAIEGSPFRQHSSRIGPWPGNGYPGDLISISPSPALKQRLVQYGLSAGRFQRHKLPEDYWINTNACPCSSLHYLLFSPSGAVDAAVPMVVYFGGSGELGTNLLDQFHQTTVFEKVCDRKFQIRHPCYLFAPMLPKQGLIQSGWPATPSALSDLICDAIYAIANNNFHPRVDTNRLYLTGLSYGGTVAFELPCQYPGRFAASVPVASIQTPFMIPTNMPGNYWLLHNEAEYGDDASRRVLDELAEAIGNHGGFFRRSSFPDKGHNAWDKAWRENAVWDWMFSFKAGNSRDMGGRSPQNDTFSQRAIFERDSRKILEASICTASIPGQDAATGPERAADGLDETYYAPAHPFGRSDWWKIEFEQPLLGHFYIFSGTRTGKGQIKLGRVEVSTDGRLWMSAAKFSNSSGICDFTQRTAIKALRVVYSGTGRANVIIREIKVVKD